MDIKCTVEGQKLTIISPRPLPQGSDNFDRFLFTFSNDWDGLMVFAQFRQGDQVSNEYLTDVTEEGQAYQAATVPNWLEPGLATMTLYGTGREDVIGTTNYVVMRVQATGFMGEAVTSDLTETLYQQMVNRFIAYEWRYDIVRDFQGACEALLASIDSPGNTWTQLPVTAAAEAPANPADGDYWWDTTNSLLKKYVVTEGVGAWETITGRTAEATAPPDVYYYYNTATGKLYRTPITAIPVATTNTVGGVKLDPDNFRIGNTTDDGAGNEGKLYLADDIYLKGNAFVQMDPESEPVSAEKLATETYVNTLTGLIRNKTDLIDVDYETNAFSFPGDVYGNGKKLDNRDELKELQTAIKWATKKYPLIFEKGYYPTRDPSKQEAIDITTPIASPNYICAYTPVNEGDTVQIKAVGGTGTQRAYALLDENYVSIEIADPNANLDATLIVPSAAKWIVVNNKVTNTDYYCYIGDNVTTEPNKYDSVAHLCGFEPYGFRAGYHYLYNPSLPVGEKEPINPLIPNASNARICAAARCVPGDQFVISTQGGSSAYSAYGFLDADGYCIERSDTNITLVNEIVTAPENAAWILVNNYINCKNYALAKVIGDRVATVGDVESMMQADKRMATYNAVEQLEFVGGHHYLYAPDYGDIQPIDPENPTPSNNHVCAYATCVEGDTFEISTRGGSGIASAYGFLDSNGLCILRDGANEVLVDRVITAPENAAYFCVNNLVSNNNYYAVKIAGDAFARKTEVANTVSNAIAEFAEHGIDVNIPVAYVNNHYWNSEHAKAADTEFNGYCGSEPIPVNAGETYNVSCYCATSNKQNPVLLVDDSNTIMAAYHDTAGEVNEFTITIPVGVTAMLLTSLVANKNDTVVTRHVSMDKGEKTLDGLTVAIIGDLISTNGPTGSLKNVPEIEITEEDTANGGVELSAYLTYYDVQAGLSLGGHTFLESEVGSEVIFTPKPGLPIDGGDVTKMIGRPANYNNGSLVTWWEIMSAVLGCNCIPVAWSGASITSHEENKQAEQNHYIYKCSYAWHESQIRKCGIRQPGSNDRTPPDAIIIYRGTNDFSHTSYAKLTDGYFDAADWSYPETDHLSAGGYGYKEGLCLTIKKLRERYPKAKIFLCTLNVFKRINYEHFPTNNGYNTLPQYNNAIREVADYMGCGLIEFDKDGITFENCYAEGYITDSADHPTHPSAKGHEVMARKAIADIRAQWNNM